MVIIKIIVFSIILSTGCVFAQDPDSGLKFGLNLSSFTGDDAYNVSRKTGLIAGAYFEKKISRVATFSIEMLLSQKGNTNTEYYNGVDTKFTRKINYLDIPLTIKFHPGEIRPLNVFVLGGLDPSIKLNSKISYRYNGSDITENMDYLNDLDLSYVIGWGVFFANGNHRTTIEMRFTQSLNSIYNDSQFLDVKNSTISFILGTNLRQVI